VNYAYVRCLEMPTYVLTYSLTKHIHGELDVTTCQSSCHATPKEVGVIVPRRCTSVSRRHGIYICLIVGHAVRRSAARAARRHRSADVASSDDAVALPNPTWLPSSSSWTSA